MRDREMQEVARAWIFLRAWFAANRPPPTVHPELARLRSKLREDRVRRALAAR